MAAVFLYVNAALYLVLSAWCTIAPTRTSESIGFAFAKASGKSEYITVYGGLEMGLGLFFLVTALDPALRPTGVLFALLTYGCLALFRIGTLVAIEDVGRFPLAMLAIELPMALLAAWLWFRPAA